jgi:hypothetical protein
MPIQTTVSGKIFFPDGAKVQVKESGASSYTDIGALNSAVTTTIEYTENQVTTANAGKTEKQLREMVANGSFTLINLDLENINRLGGGLFERVEQTGTLVADADITDQTIDGFTDFQPIHLEPVETSSGDTLKFSTFPTLTSVSGDTSGALAEGDDYFIIVDSNSPSGYSIYFDSSGTATVGTSETITVDFGDITPVSRETLYAGSSTKVLNAYALKFTHTDSNGKIREVELFSVDTNSGGFQFNFKGANEDGVEEMPIAFTGRLDTSLTDGRQLIKIVQDSGAA